MISLEPIADYISQQFVYAMVVVVVVAVIVGLLTSRMGLAIGIIVIGFVMVGVVASYKQWPAIGKWIWGLASKNASGLTVQDTKTLLLGSINLW